MTKSYKYNFYNFLIYSFILFTTVACTKTYNISDKSNSIYSDISNWSFYPTEIIHQVDTFFVSPTATSDKNFIMNFNDKDARKNIVGATNMEKGIYDDKTNFYSPFYKQATLEVYNLPKDQIEYYHNIAYNDVNNAFTYYLENINKNRPIVLAGFSQGAYHIKRLLIDHPEIQNRLVAAYIIGWNVTPQELKEYTHLKMANAEYDTGVIISFCSESPNLQSSILIPSTTKSINPLNWKTDETIANKSLNKGAVFTDYNGDIIKEIPNLTGAYIDLPRGALKIPDLSSQEYPAILSFLKEGNYHIYDYQFFYRNLEENVQKRIQAFYK